MSRNIIKINRGDTFDYDIMVYDKCDYTKKHLLTVNEVVYFALLYPNQRFEDAILIQGYTHEDQNQDTGKITVKLSANATRSLAAGTYYYTVKLQSGGTLEAIDDFDNPEEVRTIIERTKFIIND